MTAHAISTCSAMSIAEYAVAKCYEENEPITNLQLQKILYFLQVVHAKAFGTLLFDDEFEAWPYGPVIRSIYKRFSVFGSEPLRLREDEDGSVPNIPHKSFIDDGIAILRRKSPWELVSISHADGSPWDIVYNRQGAHKGTIPNDLILKAAGRL